VRQVRAAADQPPASRAIVRREMGEFQEWIVARLELIL
jgi:hypothetical protein